MNQNKYTTTSLALAAALHVASKSKLISVHKENDSWGKQSTFIFNNSPELQEVIEKFFRKELQVDAYSYFEAMKYIKARLYESGENED